MRTRCPRPIAALTLTLAFALWWAGAGFVLVATPAAGDLTIRRDRYGVPHITARHVGAAGFGFGYAQAEDHAPQMGRLYLAARGEAARALGERFLEDDVAARRVDNRAEAERALRTLGPEFRRWLDGFVAGFNHYVSLHRADLPPWMPVIVAADVLAHSRMGAAGAAVRPPPALLRRFPAPDRPPAPPDTGLLEGEAPGLDVPGSNALAIAGTRTTTGHPILLGNPHLRWSSLYWEAHVTVPGLVDFYGSTLVGFPVLRAGFNDRLGYVQTNNAPDLVDILVMPLDPARPGHYRFEGEAHPLAHEPVSVEVRTGDGALRTETREFWNTHLGPVVHRDADRVFVVRSVPLEAWRWLEGFHELAKSRSLAAFEATLRRGLLVTSNFTYADADGNVLYQWNARLPRRPELATGYALDVPADTGRYLWTGAHAFDELPRLLNPPGGYVQNANNAPWWTSLRDRLDPAGFPAYMERGALSMRAQVALQELEAGGRFSIDDVKRLKHTTRMLLAERVLPDLLSAARRHSDPSGDLRRGIETLEAWDRHASVGSRGAVLFQAFWDAYESTTAQPFAEPWDERQPIETPAGLADPDAAVVALEGAVRSTTATYGSERVALGDVRRYRFGDLDLPADGAPGGYGVYRVMGFDRAPGDAAVRIAGHPGDGQPLVGFGDAWVLLVHFGKPVTAWSVLAYGQSGDPASPHSRDQIGLFARHELRPVWFTDADIEANLARRYSPGATGQGQR
jgi:acyl-homoserine-lactone acylase